MSIEKYFDKNWETINFSQYKQKHLEVILYFINKYSKKETFSCFEFGCGNCYITNFLYEQIKNRFKKINFTVSDISKVGLSKCYNAFKKIVVSKDKMNFSTEYNSSDIVSSFEVFEHLTKDLEIFYLNELLKISRQYILIGVPYNEKLEKRVISCNSCGYTGHVYGHLRSYDMDRFSNLFKGKAKLVEYKLCGIEELDFTTRQYDLSKKMGYKILNFTCPNCVEEQNEITYFNRIKNKIIGYTILNKKIQKIEKHPFWIVGIFQKVNINDK